MENLVLVAGFPKRINFMEDTGNKDGTYNCLLCGYSDDGLHLGSCEHQVLQDFFDPQFARAKLVLEECILMESHVSRIDMLPKASWKQNVHSAMFRYITGIQVPQKMFGEPPNTKTSTPPPLMLLQKYETWAGLQFRPNDVNPPDERGLSTVVALSKLDLTMDGLKSAIHRDSAAVREMIQRAELEILHLMSLSGDDNEREAKINALYRIYDTGGHHIKTLIKAEKRNHGEAVIRFSFPDKAVFGRETWKDVYKSLVHVENNADMATGKTAQEEDLETKFSQMYHHAKELLGRCLPMDALFLRVEALTNPIWKEKVYGAMFRHVVGIPEINKTISGTDGQTDKPFPLQLLEKYESWDLEANDD